MTFITDSSLILRYDRSKERDHPSSGWLVNDDRDTIREEPEKPEEVSMVEVHLYGKLRRHAPNARASGESVVRLEPQPEETVRTALNRTGVSPDEVYHVFLNGAVLSTRNSMAPWLRYPEAEGQGWDTRVHDGDRLGLFGRDMALLVV